MRARLLDLYCGAGGGAVGYWRAGFDVVGIDIRPQPHYPLRDKRRGHVLETRHKRTRYGLVIDLEDGGRVWHELRALREPQKAKR